MKNLLLTILIITGLTFTSSASDKTETKIGKKINNLMSRVSTKRLKKDIQKLVSFYNRNTFSDQASNNKGIGAAARWLLNEFKRINKQTGGKMKVYMDSFEPQLSPRLTKRLGFDSAKISNVIAIIPGSSDRIIHLNGHYDSRNESGLDLEGFAPGANDDGSGTVALLEIARILAGEKLNNTVMLAAVTGEEQGLFGERRRW